MKIKKERKNGDYFFNGWIFNPMTKLKSTERNTF